VAYLAGRRVLPEARDPRTTGVPDPASIVCAVGAVGLIALAFTESNDWGFFGPGAIAAYAIGAAMIPVFLWRCRRAELPVLDLSLLGQRSFSSANAAALLFSIPFFGVLVADVSFVQEVWHYSVLKAGVATAITAVVGIFVSRGAGRLCDRHGHRAVLVPAALVLCASLFWRAAAVTTHPSYWTRWAGPMLALGLAIGALIPGLQSASVKYLPVDRMSMGSAFYTTVRQLGAALGVAVTVAMISRPHHGLLTNFRAAFIMHGIVGLVVTAIIAFGYRPPTGQAANQGLVMSVGE
jgi:hypothetical protein